MGGDGSCWEPGTMCRSVGDPSIDGLSAARKGVYCRPIRGIPAAVVNWLLHAGGDTWRTAWTRRRASEARSRAADCSELQVPPDWLRACSRRREWRGGRGTGGGGAPPPPPPPKGAPSP